MILKFHWKKLNWIQLFSPPNNIFPHKTKVFAILWNTLAWQRFFRENLLQDEKSAEGKTVLSSSRILPLT